MERESRKERERMSANYMRQRKAMALRDNETLRGIKEVYRSDVQ